MDRDSSFGGKSEASMNNGERFGGELTGVVEAVPLLRARQGQIVDHPKSANDRNHHLIAADSTTEVYGQMFQMIIDSL